MTMTTIKVTMETRDQLKAQAEAAGVTLGQHLTRLAGLAARDERRRAMREALARVTPAGWADYMQEFASWGAAVGDGLDPDEWTEADLLDGR